MMDATGTVSGLSPWEEMERKVITKYLTDIAENRHYPCLMCGHSYYEHRGLRHCEWYDTAENGYITTKFECNCPGYEGILPEDEVQ